MANLDAMAPNIATNTEVGLDELLEFVRPRHRMLLITERADGSPQASPVSGGVDDGGRIVVATYPQRAKTKNARHRPAVSVVVLSDEWDDAWVQVDGTCEVLDASEGEEALDAFVAYFRSIAGEHSDWRSTARRWSTRASRCCGSPPRAGAPSPPAASRRRSLHARHPVSARMSR